MAGGIHPGNLKVNLKLMTTITVRVLGFRSGVLEVSVLLDVAPYHRVIGARRSDTIQWFHLEGSKYFRP